MTEVKWLTSAEAQRILKVRRQRLHQLRTSGRIRWRPAQIPVPYGTRAFYDYHAGDVYARAAQAPRTKAGRRKWRPE